MTCLRFKLAHVIVLTCLLMSVLSMPLVAQSEFVFTQVFNVDDANTSALYVQNLSDTTATEVRVFYINQDGTEAGAEMGRLEPLASARFDSFPLSFLQGVARLSCLDTDCSATATWNFAIGGRDPVAVGVTPMDPSVSSERWAAPIPLIGPDSSFGVAAINAGTSGTTCSFFFAK